MSLKRLLSRLDAVKRTGECRWIACCPAHDDRHPSLAIRLLDDDCILLHDFGGCDTTSVLACIGLTFADLFPKRMSDHHQRPMQRPFNPRDVLTCLAMEILVIIQIANLLRHGASLSPSDHTRLLVAAQRFQSAERIVNE